MPSKLVEILNFLKSSEISEKSKSETVDYDEDLKFLKAGSGSEMEQCRINHVKDGLVGGLK